MENKITAHRMAPRHISQPADRFGYTGFTAYGYIRQGATVVHVRNPDFDFSAPQAALAAMVRSHLAQRANA